MDIVELIERIGQDKINFQFLDQCMSHAKLAKGVTMVTFGCDVPIADLGMLGPAKRRALILWIDADDLKEAMKP